MRLFLIFLAATPLIAKLNLPFLLAHLCKLFHRQCVLFLPAISSREWIGALVCGEPLDNPLLYQLLLQTSLVHLLVISVGHLQMLSWIFEQSESFKGLAPRTRRCFSWLRWMILVAFSLMSGFHPPVVRALMAEVLRAANRHFGWRWNLFLITTVSGMLTLAYQPLWIFSVSLYLPWICCLGFCIVALRRDTRHRQKESLKELVLTATLIQLLLFIPLGEFRWEGIVANAFLMPLFGLFLFPVSALTYIFRFLGPACDFFFWAFEKLLRFLLHLMGSHSSLPVPLFSTKAAWSLIIALSLMIQIFSRRLWQEDT
jgi:ComEC/Rec2-related protein